jgi:uracil-DNA glycosylase
VVESAVSQVGQVNQVGQPDRLLSAWDPARWPVAPDWRGTVDAFFASAAGRRLGKALRSRLAAGATVYPAQPLRALELTPLHAVRVVILGQDPYHGPGQAHGLAFSVPPAVPPPPSLRNIRVEIARERHVGALAAPLDERHVGIGGDLTPWTRQGVLLLNTCLTVEKGLPASHARLGWEVLTGKIMSVIQSKPEPVVYLLWGRHAQDCQPEPDAAPVGAPRLVLCANHPSPLSARRLPIPFLGCGHFAQANAFLRQHGVAPVDW